MAISLEDTEIGLLSELGKHNLEMTYNAMAPLKALDFQKLVDIHDHEEAFLRNVFLSSLIEAHNARLASGEGGTPKVTIRDVRTAMLMLGAAVSSADEQKFSGANGSIIRDICPYCSVSRPEGGN